MLNYFGDLSKCYKKNPFEAQRVYEMSREMGLKFETQQEKCKNWLLENLNFCFFVEKKLNSSPNHAYVHRSFGHLLANVFKDYDKAEKHFREVCVFKLTNP